MSVLSDRPGRVRLRPTKLAENGSIGDAASGSGWWPLSRSSKRDRIRESRKKRPWGPPGTMSPDRPEMQNEASSTSVTMPPCAPSREALSPANAQGSAMSSDASCDGYFHYADSANRIEA